MSSREQILEDRGQMAEDRVLVETVGLEKSFHKGESYHTRAPRGRFVYSPG